MERVPSFPSCFPVPPTAGVHVGRCAVVMTTRSHGSRGDVEWDARRMTAIAFACACRSPADVKKLFAVCQEISITRKSIGESVCGVRWQKV